MTGRSAWRSVDGRLWLVPLAGFAVLYCWEVTHQWFATSDTSAVLFGAAAAHDCLQAGRFTNCVGAGYDISHYPPLQYIPAFLIRLGGGSIQAAYQSLCWLNAAAFGGTAALMWHVGRKSRSRGLAPLLLACAIAAPLLWYSHAGFRESLSAFVRVAALVSILLDWPLVITGSMMCLSVLTNDPAFVFMVALAAVALLGRRRATGELARGQLIAAAVGAGSGLVLFVAFNVFRYGSVFNTWFLDAHVRVPGPGVRASSFAALLAAPNVGLLWYWPLAMLVLGVVAVVGWRRRRTEPELAALAIGVVAVLVAYLIFLIVFYSPFGWEAWGPRYLVGWIPPLLVVGGYLFARPLARALAPVFAPPWRFALVAAVILVLALPQFGVFLDWRAGFRLFDPGPSCPIHLPDPRAYSRAFGDMGPYYSCKLYQAWSHHPALLDGYAALGTPVAALQALVYALALLALLMRTRAAYSRAP